MRVAAIGGCSVGEFPSGDARTWTIPEPVYGLAEARPAGSTFDGTQGTHERSPV